MATKSILKMIHIKNSKSALKLVEALENADRKGKKEVPMSKRCSTASREEIKGMFGESK